MYEKFGAPTAGRQHSSAFQRPEIEQINVTLSLMGTPGNNRAPPPLFVPRSSPFSPSCAWRFPPSIPRGFPAFIADRRWTPAKRRFRKPCISNLLETIWAGLPVHSRRPNRPKKKSPLSGSIRRFGFQVFERSGARFSAWDSQPRRSASPR